MSMSVKFFMSVAAAAMLLVSQWAAADRPNNRRIDPKDPVVMCQKDCQREKSNESYEACMVKCQDLKKKETPAASYPKK